MIPPRRAPRGRCRARRTRATRCRPPTASIRPPCRGGSGSRASPRHAGAASPSVSPASREPLERVGARRLEQAVARHRIALGEHERLVDQRAEMIERGPRVDASSCATCCAASSVKPPANTASRRNTVCSSGVSKRVAPFERRAQRLVPAQHDARAAREQVEALVEPRAQPLDAEQRYARGGELDRERNAVEPAADLDDRRRHLPAST